MEIEIDAACGHVAEQPDQMLEGSAETADRPRRDHVELPTGNASEQGVETGALLSPFRTRYAFVTMVGDDGPTHTFGRHVEFTKLVLDGLAIVG